MSFLRSLDPKLVATVLTFALTRGILELGIAWDPTTEGIVAGVVAAVVGYLWPNDGTLLRGENYEQADAGGVKLPADLQHGRDPW
jgi:hypothetical protein